MNRREPWRSLHTARRRQWAEFQDQQEVVVEDEEKSDGGWPDRDTLFFDELED